MKRSEHLRIPLAWFVVIAVFGSQAPTALAVEPRPMSQQASLNLSFEPAAAVRLRGGRFVASTNSRLAGVNRALLQVPGAKVQRIFDASSTSLDATRRRLRVRGRQDVPDLNRHYRIVLRTPAERDELLGLLEPVGVVDEVIAEPRPAPLPATPDFTVSQKYLTAGPVGIDVAGVAGLPGGRGENVKIIDVEYSWNPAHEDLSKAAAQGALIPNGTPRDPFDNTDHGTAVLGELIGDENAFGVTGLAPRSQIGMVNAAQPGCGHACWDLANAINTARENAAPGDVILIEQQTDFGSANGGYVPVEIIPAVYDAIRLATQSGINVVEAAGNGGVNLDSDSFGTRFPDGKPDSGAIIVGAGSGDCSALANARLYFSTYGARVDLQGWGHCVTTTGYGDLFVGDTPNSSYTAGFGGTSSASPIVAAAAALYSSVHQAVRGAAPTPERVRERLISTGTPQAPRSLGHIGPLPDVAAAVAGLDDVAPTVAATTPSGDTSDVAPDSVATVSFSEPMDRASAERAFVLLRVGETTPVAGSFSWADQTMTFKPSSDLAGGERYLAGVETGARDLAGNPVAAPTIWQFTTVAAPIPDSSLGTTPAAPIPDSSLDPTEALPPAAE